MNRSFLALYFLATAVIQAEDTDPEMIFDRPQGTRDLGEFHLHSGWESRYVSEGRDNLNGNGIITATLEAGWEYLSLGTWYANSPDSSYDEIQLSAALTKEWGDLEIYLAYTHLRQPWASEHDHEIGLGAAWNGIPYGIFVALDSYYSFDTSGTFIELTCGSDYELNDCLTISPAVTFGVNQGYISDGHDGASNISANLGAEYAFTESFAISAHASYNFAIDRDVLRPGDIPLGNFLHTGVGLNWTF